MKFAPIQPDFFNKLLTSLSKSEKRYLKLYLVQQHRVEGLYYTYFDLYSTALKKKETQFLLPDYFPIDRLPSVKNYLKEKILSALAKYHQKSINRNEILAQLSNVEILFHKRLYSDCARLLRQLEKKTSYYWFYNLLSEVLQWQLRLLLSNGYKNELRISLSELYEKEDKLLHSLRYISFYRKIRYKLLNMNSQIKLTNPVPNTQVAKVSEELFSKIPTDLFPYASLEFNRTMSLFYKLTVDFKSAHLHSKNEMAIWNQHIKIIGDRTMTSKYINAHINYCEILFFLEDYEQCQIEFRQLKDKVNFLPNEHNNQVHYLALSYMVKLNINIATHNFDENSFLISEIENMLLSKINKAKVVEFLFVFAINSFCQKKWNDCLKYTNTIINEYKISNNVDFDCLSQFFRILTHFELGNIEVVENLIHRFNYQISEINLLFKAIRQYFKQPLLYQKLSINRLNEIKVDLLTQERQAHQFYQKLYYVAFLDWINSKLLS